MKLSTDVALEQGLLAAQNKAKHLLQEIENRDLIEIGSLESAVSEKIYQLAFDLFGTKKHWHKRIIRAGENTILTFSDNPPDRILQEGDLVYADLGPVFDEYEGDVGKTYLLGKDADKERLVVDLERIFSEVKRFYLPNPSLTGAQVWDKVMELTQQAGWKFGNYHAGHIIGEFSHIQNYGKLPQYKISAQNDMPLNARDKNGKAHHWILEIHLVDEEEKYGGFFEDLLTL